MILLFLSYGRMDMRRGFFGALVGFWIDLITDWLDVVNDGEEWSGGESWWTFGCASVCVYTYTSARISFNGISFAFGEVRRKVIGFKFSVLLCMVSWVWWNFGCWGDWKWGWCHVCFELVFSFLPPFSFHFHFHFFFFWCICKFHSRREWWIEILAVDSKEWVGKIWARHFLWWSHGSAGPKIWDGRCLQKVWFWATDDDGESEMHFYHHLSHLMWSRIVRDGQVFGYVVSLWVLEFNLTFMSGGKSRLSRVEWFLNRDDMICCTHTRELISHHLWNLPWPVMIQ